MGKDTNFILTDDKTTADKLVKLGFQVIQMMGRSWLFLNDNSKLMYAQDENLKYTFTNKMMF